VPGALAIREKVLGPEHPGTAESLNDLGVLLKAQGELAAVRRLDERALAIREKVLGSEQLLIDRQRALEQRLRRRISKLNVFRD
jgi:hypothetical protein